MSDFNIPVTIGTTVGPGTQPDEEDGAILDYLEMPSEMATYTMPELPEDMVGHEKALEVMLRLKQALNDWRGDSANAVVANAVVDVTTLPDADRELIDQVLGEGEVSLRFEAEQSVDVQESVLAGVWRVRYHTTDGDLAQDCIEVGAVPSMVLNKTFTGAQTAISSAEQLPDGVYNAPALLSELDDQLHNDDREDTPHVINLTLLPVTDEDLSYLGETLGTGPVTILSRGYGNCRITSTATANVWWVQYFNSQDAIILNTLEVTPVPNVACAAGEDIEDSAQRLGEIIEVYAQ